MRIGSTLIAAAIAACLLSVATGFAFGAAQVARPQAGPRVVGGESSVVHVGNARRGRGAVTPSASLSVPSCVSAPLAANRLLKASAVMVGVSGTAHMAMRFHLGETLASSQEHEITGSGLGVWETLKSARSTTRWTKDKTISSLKPSAYYRVWVDYRWVNSAGREIAHRTISASRCVQADVRPDLSISEAGAVTHTVAKSGRPGRFDYQVKVTNKGRGTSAATKVRVIVPGQNLVDAPLLSIERGHLRTVTVLDVEGCAASGTIIQVDPESRTGDSSTANNVATVPCT